MSSKFTFRALEIHDFTYIWNFDEIRRRLKFMVENDLNALVLHQPGIEEKVVFPGKFLGAAKEGRTQYEIFQQIDENILNYALLENLNINRREYLRFLIQEAAEVGIEVYFENKELWFKDFILKYKPDLVKDGVFCPSDPFWWEEFLPAKYEELFISLPGLAGTVTSCSTGEARLSISNVFPCTCSRCQNLDPTEWHKNIIMGMYKAFKKAGKRLIIRDFIYTIEEQEKFRTAFNELPDDIWLSLKNTPHDFYPTFPNNPLIGRVGNHPQVIEYDVNGQFYGWGQAPATVLKDIQERIKYGMSRGIQGFIARTDWEGVQDVSCFDNPNLINLYGIAAFGKNPDADFKDIYYRWLSEEGMLRDDLSPSELKRCLEWIMELFDQTWPIIEKSVYVNGTVFSNDSCLHINLKQPTFIAETHHSRKNWDEDSEDALTITEDNVERMLTEKETAYQLVKEVYDKFIRENPGLTEGAYKKLKKHFRFMRMYVKGFKLTGTIYALTRYALEVDTNAILRSKPVSELLNGALAELRDYKDELEQSDLIKIYPFGQLLNPERVECFAQDIENRLAKVKR